MAEVVTFALEIDIVLDVRTGGLAIEVPVKYTGDLYALDSTYLHPAINYSSADLTITIPFQVIESKLITSSGTNYIFDDTANTWEPLPGDSPFFAGPSVFLGTGASDTTDVVLVRSETIDGAETHVVSAKRPGVEIGGAIGDLEVLYWIGVDDGLLRKVEASGLVEFGEQGVPGLDFSIASANATLTATFFDYGKTVDISTPELAFPRFIHQAVYLDDRRLLVTGGVHDEVTGGRHDEIPVGLIQIYDFETGLWMLENPASRMQDDWRIFHSVVRLPDGKVFRVGIQVDAEWSEFLGVADIFDPAANVWKSLPDPPTFRLRPHLVLLNDGRVLSLPAVQGVLIRNASRLEPTVELFDPKAGQWHHAADMLVFTEQELLVLAANDQAAVPLQDGRVLVMGGNGERGSIYASRHLRPRHRHVDAHWKLGNRATRAEGRFTHRWQGSGRRKWYLLKFKRRGQQRRGIRPLFRQMDSGSEYDQPSLRSLVDTAFRRQGSCGWWNGRDNGFRRDCSAFYNGIFRSKHQLVVARTRTLRAALAPLRDPPARRESPPRRRHPAREGATPKHLDGVRHAVAIGPAIWHTVPCTNLPWLVRGNLTEIDDNADRPYATA